MKTTNTCHVRLITTPNSDLKVVNAARVSFAKEVSELSDGDEGLIRYLATHAHWTPFSHCRESFACPIDSNFHEILEFLSFDLTQAMRTGLVLLRGPDWVAMRHSLYGWSQILNLLASRLGDHEPQPDELSSVIYARLMQRYPLSSKYLLSKQVHELFGSMKDIAAGEPYVDHPEFIDVTMQESVPIFVARQRFKHMVGTTYNEVSRRYVSTEPVFFIPDVWRKKHENKKQGSMDCAAEYMTETKEAEIIDRMHDSVVEYLSMVENHVCPEQARMTLHQNMMTDYYVTSNLDALQRMLHQRLDSHAQLEIQDLAKLVQEKLFELITEERQNG